MVMRSLGQALVLMIVLSAILEMWPYLLAAVALVVVVRLLALWDAVSEERRADDAERAAYLIEHADREHAQVLNGDVAGVYGSYPVPEELRGVGIWLAGAPKSWRSPTTRPVRSTCDGVRCRINRVRGGMCVSI